MIGALGRTSQDGGEVDINSEWENIRYNTEVATGPFLLWSKETVYVECMEES